MSIANSNANANSDDSNDVNINEKYIKMINKLNNDIDISYMRGDIFTLLEKKSEISLFKRSYNGEHVYVHGLGLLPLTKETYYI